MMEQLTDFLGLGIMSVVLVLVALLLAVIGWFQSHGARAAMNWATTQGDVMEATVETYQYSSSEGGTSTGHRPRIIYSYRINGRDYVGDRFNFGSEVHSSIRSFAEGTVKKYPTGSKVTVFYNPQNPGDAALERSAPASKLLYVIAAILFVVAIGTCVFGSSLGALF
jgi:hypothetical protein